MISKYLLTLVYNRLNNVSKLRVLYWYTGIARKGMDYKNGRRHDRIMHGMGSRKV